jgi:hypothetical protein
MRPFATLLLLGSATLALACSDPNELPKAQEPNFVDTLTMFALTGTPIQLPSAYSVLDGLIRTDRTSSFDFAFDIDSLGNPLFLPQAVLDLQINNTVDPGLLPTTKLFGAVHRAPSNGYTTSDTLAADSGKVFIVRSRIVCNIGVSQYSKIQVISLDSAQRSLTFQVLANNNCGYRDLDTGIPKD